MTSLVPQWNGLQHYITLTYGFSKNKIRKALSILSPLFTGSFLYSLE
jgi:hypothetical protein